MKTKVIFVALMATLMLVAPQAKAQYVNPVTTIDAADPSVILAEDGYYYMYSSEVTANEGLRVWRSSDMINWTMITKIFPGAATDSTRPDELTYSYLWAPEVAYVNGKYLMFYANAAYGTQSETQICVATSDTPYGPFENNKVLIRAHDSNYGALNANTDNIIDPSLFRDDNGKNYLLWGSWHGIWYVELDAACTSITSSDKKQFMSKGTLYKGDWENVEAPMVIKRNGYYYLVCSRGTTVGASDASGITYNLAMARSTSIGGEFVDPNGNNAFGKGSGLSNGTMWGLLQSYDYALGPGHCSQIVKDFNGKEWIFYHAYPKKSDGTWDYPGQRKLYVSELLWDKWYSGWPGIQPPTDEVLNTTPTIDPEGAKGEDVKEIYNAADLMAFATYVNGGHPYATALIMNDIDMSGVTDYTPIGTVDNRFQGVIEGNYHSIKNLKINHSDVERQGLIGSANGGVQVKNLIIDSSCEIIGGSYTGAFIGRIDGVGSVQFINCGNEAYVKGGQNTSGFVGCDSGVSLYFDNCYNTGYIDGGSESAAFSGWGIDRLRNCWNTGRTIGCQGAGDGYWYSLARDYNSDKNVNSYDLNLENAPVTYDRLADYDSSWLANGHFTYYINNIAGYDAWLQNIDADLNPIDQHPVFIPSHLPVVTDGSTYYNNKSTADYTRNTTAGRFGTLCLAYPTSATSGAVFYNVVGVRKTGDDITALIIEELDDQQHLEAGKSYIFKANGSLLTCTYYNANRASASMGTFGLVGNLVKEVMNVSAGNYLLTNNTLRKITDSDNATLGINRAYIVDLTKLPEYQASGSSKIVSFGLDGNISEGETDGIHNLEPETWNLKPGTIYNLAGQRVGENYRGIVIKNGKKYIAK